MIKTRFLLLVISLFILTPIACQTSRPMIHSLTEDDIAAIRLIEEQYRDAEAINDWQTISMFYTENAIRMLPHGPTVQGRDAILQEFEARPYSITEYDSQTEEIDGFGDIAFTRGVYSWAISYNSNISRGTGKFIAIYRKQPDGRWLIDRDIFNDKVSQ